MGQFREQSEELQERVNEILMDSTLSVIVEGEHDVLAYENFLDKDYCHIEQFQGKEKALQVIGEVNKQNPKRAIAIIDSDLDVINGREYPDNIFLTDAHDIDTQMFLSKAYYRVAREYYTNDNTAPQKKMDDIRDEIISFALPLSFMRAASDALNYHFAFKASAKHPKPFPYGRLVKVERKTIEYLGDDNMIKVTCCYRNQGVKKNVNEIKAKITELYHKGYDVKYILHGHDLMNMMGLLIIRYGKRDSSVKPGEEVEQAFRLSYFHEFHNSILYQNLKKYANNTSIPFVV